jgi:L-asparaginase/Glu-tRNA(Gln) amidotransferase subunit D
MREGGQETSMNHSIYSADKMTHLKIVVVALVAGILVAGFGISTRSTTDEGLTQTARVMKAGKPVVITSSGNSLVR